MLFQPVYGIFHKNSYTTLSLLNVPMEVHGNILDKNKQREIIEFETSVSIGNQDTSYDYNGKFRDYI